VVGGAPASRSGVRRGAPAKKLVHFKRYRALLQDTVSQIIKSEMQNYNIQLPLISSKKTWEETRMPNGVTFRPILWVDTARTPQWSYTMITT